jgi:putative transposase
MPGYRRAWHPGGPDFFSVSLLQCHGDDLLTHRIDLLREIVTSVQSRHPVRIHA